MFDQTCYTLTSEGSALRLCAAMNSTLLQLMANLGGRSNFGGGLLRIATYKLASLMIVNPQILPEVDATVFNAADWDELTPSGGPPAH